MLSLKQRTIRTTAATSGPLLHAPGSATVVFSPAPEDTGWVFIRSDLPGNPHIPCRPENIDVRCRWATVRQGEASVSVFEHLLAACRGLGIDNLFISVDTDGVPMPDGGSAKPSIPPGNLLEIRYKDLCQDPIKTFRMAAEFSALEWLPEFEATVKGFPLRNTNDKWREHLSDTQHKMLNECLGHTLEKYGYT